MGEARLQSGKGFYGHTKLRQEKNWRIAARSLKSHAYLADEVQDIIFLL